MPQMPPFDPMAHALGMLPFMMQAQQFQSFMPNPSLHEQALQQPNYPSNFPLLFDPALFFASACYGQGDFTNIPGFNVDSEQFVAMRAQNL